jgi:hypothetical protein
MVVAEASVAIASSALQHPTPASAFLQAAVPLPVALPLALATSKFITLPHLSHLSSARQRWARIVPLHRHCSRKQSPRTFVLVAGRELPIVRIACPHKVPTPAWTRPRSQFDVVLRALVFRPPTHFFFTATRQPLLVGANLLYFTFYYPSLHIFSPFRSFQLFGDCTDDRRHTPSPTWNLQNFGTGPS